MYVCWLGFEVVFVYLYVVETKNVSTISPMSKPWLTGLRFFSSQRTLEETAA